MPRSHGNLRSVACNLSRGRLPGRLSAGIALLASALGASLVSAPAQEVRIIKPGSMAVTGFSGTTIPGQGQFGEENGGSPGAIWKVDGLTGAVSLFTTI
ncbi:MAG TPA: hypothetical protein VIZ90_17465, partial [Rhizobiaceae bacterium]